MKNEVDSFEGRDLASLATVLLTGTAVGGATSYLLGRLYLKRMMILMIWGGSSFDEQGLQMFGIAPVTAMQVVQARTAYLASNPNADLDKVDPFEVTDLRDPMKLLKIPVWAWASAGLGLGSFLAKDTSFGAVVDGAFYGTTVAGLSTWLFHKAGLSKVAEASGVTNF